MNISVKGNQITEGDWSYLPIIVNGGIEWKVYNSKTGCLWYFDSLDGAREATKLLINNDY